jgi:hypothetical protein
MQEVLLTISAVHIRAFMTLLGPSRFGRQYAKLQLSWVRQRQGLLSPAPDTTGETGRFFGMQGSLNELLMAVGIAVAGFLADR